MRRAMRRTAKKLTGDARKNMKAQITALMKTKQARQAA
jgi:hypothetical protein